MKIEIEIDPEILEKAKELAPIMENNLNEYLSNLLNDAIIDHFNEEKE